MTSNAGKRITFYDIAALFGAAYTRGSTIDKAVSGFSSCERPFNPAGCSDADFAPPLMTDRDETAPASGVQQPVTAPNDISTSEPLRSSAHVEVTNLSESSTLPDTFVHHRLAALRQRCL